ncbi:hypothetical protein M5K25_013731 [Dendrobium thyrsiflorum]|uniref:Uncharacterized protein n=1 Tax=Dendrobium thyrsiflorum TaxID=117978 RepID=A0ABD0UUI8_DENTH
MEGIIPFVYKAIVQYRSGGQSPMGVTWLQEFPSVSYVRLPGDSGRFRPPLELGQMFTSSSPPPPAATKQSPLRRSSSCRRSY